MGAELASVGLGAAAGVFGSMDAGRKRKRQDQRLKGQEAKMMAALEGTLGPQEIYLKRALKGIESSYDSALEDIGRAEGVGLDRIGQQQQAALGNIRGGFGGSGLYGSSVMANAQRGVAQDASAATIDLLGSGARARGGLKIQRGQASAGALGQLANFQAYKAGAVNNILANRWNFIANQNYAAQPLNLGGIGQLAGLFGGADSAAGGGGGMTGGGAAPQSPFGFPASN
jgi:hypothetical protein